ncbi:hypothetical protein PoB_006738700 [Plakobranchus ocellatus]|uniref:Uncharacterized protein n=1 Tax=Plakobranchus ocellatus TaxID=259542 RepID=A0AAV4DA13_9GAST|nr:hypothetical protein PoB_006738700 [Plakobranchus ocellatus]
MSEQDSNPHPRWHPPPCQTEEPSEQALNHPLPQKIEASDSAHQASFPGNHGHRISNHPNLSPSPSPTPSSLVSHAQYDQSGPLCAANYEGQ